MGFKVIGGDLIKLAQQGKFDVIAHGCNCFCTMGAGIAPQVAKAFGADIFPMEAVKYKGWINKLGNIDFKAFDTKENKLIASNISRLKNVFEKGGDLIVVNAYTQYHYGGKRPLDYAALNLCFKKMNHIFKGKHIGLPWIGCGLAGGDKGIVAQVIKNNFKDCDITIVNYEKQ